MTSTAINKLSSAISLPVYRRIEEDLRARIRDGYWTVDTQIPGRRELAKHYQVEVSTVQRAIASLLYDGVLRSESGRGTFVAIGATQASPVAGPSLRLGIALRDASAMTQADSYMAHIVQGVRRALSPHGLRHSILFVEDSDLDRLPQMPRSEMAGLLLASPDIDKRTLVDHMWRSGVPLVVVGSSWVGMESPFVDCDNIAGTNANLDLLVAAGHTDIACAVVNANACHHYDRAIGFRDGMARHGLTIRPDWIIERWKPTPEQGYDDIRRLLMSPTRPTALVAVDPSVAIMALRVASELGLSVPSDLSIVTFDDTVRAENSSPPLTTIAAPFEEMGRLGMEMLINLCHGNPFDRSPQLLPMRQIVRQSVGACPK
ncbi:MAG TPA: GntR family transcriptional regulator [Capsulimonadaceae bacterium]|jgi:DNA-binding LacI/PurR family transcriptional regulator